MISVFLQQIVRVMKAGTVCMFATEIMVPDPRKLHSKYLEKGKQRKGRKEGGSKDMERKVPIYGNRVTF